jgi:hypothetical protein
MRGLSYGVTIGSIEKYFEECRAGTLLEYVCSLNYDCKSEGGEFSESYSVPMNMHPGMCDCGGAHVLMVIGTKVVPLYPLNGATSYTVPVDELAYQVETDVPHTDLYFTYDFHERDEILALRDNYGIDFIDIHLNCYRIISQVPDV